MTTVGEVIAYLEQRFPSSRAEEWDAVGLVTGRRASAVHRIVLAVEATSAVVRDALDAGADLLVLHHPVYLRGTTTIDGDSPKGSLMHDAIRAGMAVYVAHTNADKARPGVSDALAEAIGVIGTQPVLPEPDDATLGLGRVGALPAPTTLAALAASIARALSGARGGVRWAGEPDRVVQRVAVCGGSGADLLEHIDADVYVTSDLRHHTATDYLATGRAALIDIPHAVGESLWLDPLARELVAHFDGITTHVHPDGCDPWSGVIPA